MPPTAPGCSPAPRGTRSTRIYVPNSESDTVDVIDPHTFKVVDHFDVGSCPQHVTPSWDLRSLYVLNDIGNSLTRIDPTHREARHDDPGRGPVQPVLHARRALRDRGRRATAPARLPRPAHDSRCTDSLHVPCAGVDHMDFTADGTLAVASCEFSGQLVDVDVEHPRVIRTLTLPDGPRRCRRT